MIGNDGGNQPRARAAHQASSEAIGVMMLGSNPDLSRIASETVTKLLAKKIAEKQLAGTVDAADLLECAREAGMIGGAKALLEWVETP